MLRNQTKYYSEVKEHQQEIRKLNHDMKQIMSAYITSINTDNSEVFKEKASRFIDILDNKFIIETGNDAINALISTKINYANKCNVGFECKADFVNLKIDEIDFCILVGNLLDNAIEAAARVATDNKLVKFLGNITGDSICIKCVNSTGSDVLEFQTSKLDKKNHGFGVNQIHNIVKKYYGNITFTKENSEVVSIIILTQNII